MRARLRSFAPYLVLMVVSLVLRLIDLGDRPFHHDESQDAYFSWLLAIDGKYEYDPLLHGPFRFYLTSLAYLVLGDTDTTARLAPALMGTAIVGLPYFLRRQLGNAAALTAAVLLCAGPTFLYFSRFAREDIYIACINLALLVAVFRFLDRPARWGPPVIGALLAIAFATKESTFITAFVAGTFFITALVVERVRAGSWREAPLVRTVGSVGSAAWIYGLASFVIVYSVLFTVFFTDPDGVLGLYDGLDYWLGQQPVARGGEPWYFYFAVLTGHEWPVILLGLFGAVVALRHPTRLRLFLVWAFVLSLAVYSWASEKFAWLAMHPLLPLILLAGVGVQALWDARRRFPAKAGLALAGATALYLGLASFWVNAEHRANPREFLVSTQSSEDVLDVRDRIVAANRRAEARSRRRATITVDSHEGGSFPWAWYLRDMGAGYLDLSVDGSSSDSEVLLLTEAGRERLLPQLTAYEGRRFRFRVWWVRDWSRKFDADAWWKWWTERKVWNPTGQLYAWLYVRRDLSG